jgi:hypothetical protein
MSELQSGDYIKTIYPIGANYARFIGYINNKKSKNKKIKISFIYGPGPKELLNEGICIQNENQLNDLGFGLNDYAECDYDIINIVNISSVVSRESRNLSNEAKFIIKNTEKGERVIVERKKNIEVSKEKETK